MVTPTGGPRERCPFSSRDLSAHAQPLRSHLAEYTLGNDRKGDLVGTPAGGPRERCPFFGRDLSGLCKMKSGDSPRNSALEKVQFAAVGLG